MDEQTTAATTNEDYAPETDGTYTDYDAPIEAPLEDRPPEDSYDDAPLPPDDAPEPEVSLTEDGEVNFSDDFFGDVEDEPEPEEPPYYTDEELSRIPFEQWDRSRLHGDIQKFLPIYEEQLRRRQAQQQVMQRRGLPAFLKQPQEYTPQELADEAEKLACEKLGLDDPDDFDEYEKTHQAAFKLASDELSEARRTARAVYERGVSEWTELQRFNAELAGRPDFPEFDRWVCGKFRANGVTPAQVDAAFMEYAKQSGGDFRNVQGVIANWYKEFQQERGARPRPRARMSRPPVLESTRGSSYEGRRSVKMSDFREMDMDRQADALMKMGIV